MNEDLTKTRSQVLKVEDGLVQKSLILSTAQLEAEDEVLLLPQSLTTINIHASDSTNADLSKLTSDSTVEAGKPRESVAYPV